MDDIIVEVAREAFVGTFNRMLERLRAAGAEECTDVVDDAFLDAWFAHLSAPLPAKRVKYAKAVERILSQPGTHFHACAYKDAVGLDAPLPSGFVLRRAIEGALPDEELDAFWRTLGFANRLAHDARRVAPPRVPTRDEIAANIKQRRGADDGDSSLAKSIAQAFAVLGAECATDKLGAPTESEAKAHIERWAEFAREFGDACARRDEAATRGLQRCFPEFGVPDVLSDAAWDAVVQLNQLSAVGANVPPNMMSRIESIANKLARDMDNGTVDESSVDLHAIGQQVLAGCNEDELSAFAGNIAHLMPLVQSAQFPAPS